MEGSGNIFTCPFLCYLLPFLLPPRHHLSKIMLLSMRIAARGGALSRGVLAMSRSGGGSFS